MAESLSIGNPDSNLADLGRVAPRTYWRPLGWWWGTSGLGDVAGREAMVNACGVGMAMVQGHNWVPTPRRGEESERGNHHGPAQEARRGVTGLRALRTSGGGSWGEATGGEEHSEAVVVGVAESSGEAPVEFDDAVDGLGAAVVRATSGEVRQERVTPPA